MVLSKQLLRQFEFKMVSDENDIFHIYQYIKINKNVGTPPVEIKNTFLKKFQNFGVGVYSCLRCR